MLVCFQSVLHAKAKEPKLVSAAMFPMVKNY